MATVTRRNTAKATRIAERDPAALVIAIGPAKDAARTKNAGAPVAAIVTAVASSTLTSKLERAMARALEDLAKAPLPRSRVVRVISRKALDRIGAAIEGAFVIVPVTTKNLGRVGEIVDGVRRARALGVQLAWDGENPPRDRAEPKVFAILERARATPSEAPVVLSRGEDLVEALRVLARPKAITSISVR